MLWYIVKQSYLFVITLLILTMLGYQLLRLDSDSFWGVQHFWEGWFLYIGNLSQLDFGVTSEGIPIIDELSTILPATLELCFFALFLTSVIAIPIGLYSGIRKNKLADKLINFVAMAGYSMPLFLVAILMIMFFSIELKLLPVSGRYHLLYEIPTVTGFALIDAFLSSPEYRIDAVFSVIKHMTLPSIVLALSPTMQLITITRNSVATVIGQNYIRAARIRRLSTFSIIHQHLIRNAIYSTLPQFGTLFSNMLTLAIITEYIFNWPGIGLWLLNALSNNDYTSIQAGVIVVATLVLSSHVFSAFLVVLLNPLARKRLNAS